jgi:carbamoyltransferase
MATRVLGICTEPDGFSAAVVVENRVVAALEQFKIRAHWSPHEAALLPREAILASLDIAKVDLARIEVVAFTAESHSTAGIIPHIRALGLSPEAAFEQVDPWIAHAASAFYSSPFDRAAILILGSEREFTTACLAVGDGGRIELEDIADRHSALGALYSQVSHALGFNPRTSNKVAWLAAAGEPEFLDVFREVMFWGHNKPLSGKLLAEVDLTRRQNVAASLQARTNELVIQTAQDLCGRHNVSNLCVAGYLAENPLLVRELEQHFGPDHVFVPAAPGMESLSIGAALARSSVDRRPEPHSRSSYPALGPEFSDSEIKAELENCKLVSTFLSTDETLVETACNEIVAGSLVGWFQGRCEFGHRSLGFRSIVANPFTPYIDENINRFLKHRESFHPFVISVPEESAGEYFHQVGPNARTIASVYRVKDEKRELLSKFAVQDVYVRVHTVRASDNPLFSALLRRMESFIGHPMLINTSFNLPGEPLVLTPRDAIRSFFASGLDLLVMGRFLVTK